MPRTRFYGRSSRAAEHNHRRAVDRARESGPPYAGVDLIEIARRTAELTRKSKI